MSEDNNIPEIIQLYEETTEIAPGYFDTYERLSLEDARRFRKTLAIIFNSIGSKTKCPENNFLTFCTNKKTENEPLQF